MRRRRNRFPFRQPGLDLIVSRRRQQVFTNGEMSSNHELEGALFLAHLRRGAAEGNETSRRILTQLEEHLGSDEDVWKIWLATNISDGEQISRLLMDSNLERVCQILEETPSIAHCNTGTTGCEA